LPPDLGVPLALVIFKGLEFGVLDFGLETAKWAEEPLVDFARERMRTRRSEIARGVGVSRLVAVRGRGLGRGFAGRCGGRVVVGGCGRGKRAG